MLNDAWVPALRRSFKGTLHRVRDTSAPIARCTKSIVPNSMASNPTAAPILFDRAPLRVRQDRARRVEPATFLLDRVAEDIEERLHAVVREFDDAADIWTPDDILRKL